MNERDLKETDSSTESGESDISKEPSVPAINTDAVRRELEKFLIQKDAQRAVTRGRGGRFLIN